MPLLTLQSVSIGFRGPPLLDGVSCQIEPKQRIGLLGRNGAGKTTFLKLLAGVIDTDAGEVVVAPGVRTAWLPQDVPLDVVGKVADLLAAVSNPNDDKAAGELDADGHDGQWRRERRVARLIQTMGLPAEASFETLSSGMKRRVLLARALADGPDVLLLDEPTNHLDVDSVMWLEEFLSNWEGTLVFVTHDRAFLRRLATRIIEIDRGRLFDWSCDYDAFLVRKEAALAAEERQNALFDKKLAQEEVWIRTGIKARRTRNEGRVRALEALRRERSERRERIGTAKLEIQAAPRGGALVAELDQASFAYGDRTIFRNLSTTIMRGDKLGIIGPNGVGKSTLLGVLLGSLRPTSGTVRLGTNLQIAYFDQLRRKLDENATVVENVGEGAEMIAIEGRSRHIVGYLQDFLFEPDRARTPVRFLSGGERCRVLLAKLFAKPANVIVLDEPTNDLDAETLEMLEDRLIEFTGTVLAVSHDRTFLNNVVAGVLSFEDGDVKEYVGGWDDWQRQRRTAQGRANEASERGKTSATSAASPQPGEAPTKRKLSFKERRELDGLPAEIERIEASISLLHEAMAAPDFYRQAGDRIAAEQAKLKELEDRLAQAYARWEELEAAGA